MTRKFDNIIFDLDGTLLDSGPGIINAVKYALKKYGIDEKNTSILRSFVGPPLHQQFSECYAFSEKQSLEAVDYFREYYTTKGILENTVYPEIKELLAYLADNDYCLLIASSKPENLVKEILTQHDLLRYFKYAGGSLLDGSRENKDDVLQYVLDTVSIKDFHRCLMIGDRKFDILGSRKFAIKSVGVTYGYGSLAELQSVQADFFIDKPLELISILK